MRLPLKTHPDSSCRAVTGIGVEVIRPSPATLLLRFSVSGATDGIRLPPPARPERTDGLWRHTCFEAFIRGAHGAAYYEFNFSPSTEWAAYAFDGYRSGMRALSEINAPRIEMRSGGTQLDLQAALDLGGITELPEQAAWRLALSAIIEEAEGRKSWWALAHAPGKPDFHHPDGFTLELSAA